MELVIYLLKSMAVLFIFYVVYFLFLRKDTLFQAKRHYFIAGIMAALLLPFLEFTNILYIELPTRASASIMEELTYNTAVEEAIPSTAVNLWNVAIGLYLLGVMVMLGRLSVQLFSLLKLLRSYPSQKLNNFNFVEIDQKISPFSFFKFIAYNPRTHTREELEMILRHEEVHAGQWHSVDVILGQIIRCIQWINPFSWLYKNSMEENLEFIADHETVSRVPSKKQYQLTMVKASSTLYAPALTTHFYQSFIKKRIIMLNKSHSNKRNLWKICIVLPLLAVFLWSFNVKEVVEYKENPPLLSSIKANPALKEVITSEKNKVPITNNLANNARVKNHNLSAKIAKIKPTNDSRTLALATVNNSRKIKTSAMAEFKFTITKDTSEEELKRIKRELAEEHSIDFSYTTVRNDNSEITSISINYSGDGKNGSYNVSEDSPISEFVFYMLEDGKSGFSSSRTTTRSLARQENRTKNRKLRKEEMELRREQISERRERPERIEEEHEAHEAYEAHEAHEYKHEEIEEHHGRLARTHGSSAHMRHHGDSEHRIRIDKNTSDEALADIKRRLKAKGISFSYSKVRRNSKGEITRIRIDTNNNRGSKSTVSAKADDGEPINDVLIEI